MQRLIVDLSKSLFLVPTGLLEKNATPRFGVLRGPISEEFLVVLINDATIKLPRLAVDLYKPNFLRPFGSYERVFFDSFGN